MENFILNNFELKTSNINNKESSLGVIVPLRVSTDRQDAIDRLQFLKMDAACPNDVTFLIIDDGSPIEYSNKILAKCKEYNLGYAKINSESSIFSIGRCRNVGAMLLKTEYILFQDVDLMIYDGFYNTLLTEIDIQDLNSNARDFLMVPYIFLTEYGTKEYLKLNERKRRQFFLHKAIIGDDNYIEKISCGTSATVYRRIYFLARGGNDDRFEGWGYEDLECNARCFRHANKFPTPSNWALDYKNFFTICEYKGWKSGYRLFGDLLFTKGIATFHAWHPTGVAGSSYLSTVEKNRKLFNELLSKHSSKHISDPPHLPDLSQGRTLLFRSNPFVSQREFAPRWGEILLMDESQFIDENSFLTYISENNISRVVFHNPYANEKMHILYQICRNQQIKYFVCERGALDRSFFFDPNGFLDDSSSYAPEKWDHPISLQAEKNVLDYIRLEKAGDNALESQNSRIGARNLRRQLGISSAQKVLFVALQRPGDSATRFFCGKTTYHDYYTLIANIVEQLPEEWVAVIKKHPLEDEIPNFGSKAIFANDSHFKDLLSLSNAVLTFNSGIGILAMLWNIPVFLVGRAFYAHEDINKTVTCAKDILYWIDQNFSPDFEKIKRFIHYLAFEFYSFGDFITKPVLLTDGSRMTATTDIKIEVIRGLFDSDYHLINRKRAELSWNSLLYDRYRSAMYGNDPKAKKITSKKTQPTKQPSTIQDLLQCTDNSKFLHDAYKRFLGRSPDPRGKQYYSEMLSAKQLSRKDVCVYLAISPEGKEHGAKTPYTWYPGAAFQKVKNMCCASIMKWTSN